MKTGKLQFKSFIINLRKYLLNDDNLKYQPTIRHFPLINAAMYRNGRYFNKTYFSISISGGVCETKQGSSWYYVFKYVPWTLANVGALTESLFM